MGPLAGIRIVDFSRLAPGPYCSMILADMGADVIRIDRSGSADTASVFGDVVSRGKRSVALNLKHPAGVEIALKICESSDVLLEGFRPGVMERLGLSPEVVSARNPKLVYARLTGWGQTGPLAQRAGHDINYIAMSGVLGAFGERGGPPRFPVNLIGDFAGGSLFCAIGILSALVARSTTGKGQVVDAAMVDGAAHLFSFFAKLVEDGVWGARGTNALDGGAHYYGVYETLDGEYMSVGAIEPQFYAELLKGLALPSEFAARQHDPTSNEEFRATFADVFKTRTRDQWAEVFGSTDACVFPVLSPREAPTHPANLARDVFCVGPDKVTQPSPAPRLSDTPLSIASAPPQPGEHTAELLQEFGLTPTQINEIVSAGVIS